MDILKKLIPGWGEEVIFRIYMIHERDSEFEWKPELETLCRDYDARVRSHTLDITYESARLDMMTNRLISQNKEIPESLVSKIDEIDDLLESGTHWNNKVFNITISVDRESLRENKIDPDSIEKLRREVMRILEDSDPWYLSLE
ncbi:MAG: hypothetical protein B6U86_00720 [Candidatus Altiarchaeales archaeon ex4484_43]|nr:MAG: hypothetical protein B6U86_00720 [Candidatus Altiarchaeales archaeon ex4484_43]RLI88662.1 MAG: hypothetical protein DRO62_03305 [Candidatus Altiarchaeales archaeon]